MEVKDLLDNLDADPAATELAAEVRSRVAAIEQSWAVVNGLSGRQVEDVEAFFKLYDPVSQKYFCQHGGWGDRGYVFTKLATLKSRLTTWTAGSKRRNLPAGWEKWQIIELSRQTLPKTGVDLDKVWKPRS